MAPCTTNIHAQRTSTQRESYNMLMPANILIGPFLYEMPFAEKFAAAVRLSVFDPGLGARRIAANLIWATTKTSLSKIDYTSKRTRRGRKHFTCLNVIGFWANTRARAQTLVLDIPMFMSICINFSEMPMCFRFFFFVFLLLLSCVCLSSRAILICFIRQSERTDEFLPLDLVSIIM